jgi:hypothetical protein
MSSSALVTSPTSTQYHLTGSDGAAWQAVDSSGLETTYTPTTTASYIVSGNADLWTANSGINQDIGIVITGGVYATPTLVAWKESGGFAGAYSPNAAYVETVLNLQASTTYTITLVWKPTRRQPARRSTPRLGHCRTAGRSPRPG